jgi:hypothetical protein
MLCSIDLKFSKKNVIVCIFNFYSDFIPFIICMTLSQFVRNSMDITSFEELT